MKKPIASLMVGLLLLCAVGTSSALNENRGGLMGFIAGCCFGMRAGAAYNDGKEIHWREWVLIIPVANIVFAIWLLLPDFTNTSSCGYFAWKAAITGWINGSDLPE